VGITSSFASSNTIYNIFITPPGSGIRIGARLLVLKLYEHNGHPDPSSTYITSALNGGLLGGRGVLREAIIIDEGPDFSAHSIPSGKLESRQ
jgi:hypothetical protein